MTVSPRVSGPPAPYVVGPSLEFSNFPALTRYLKAQLSSIAASTATIALMTPQVATKEPPQVADGMIRLARAPWHPASGQTTDAWVYYDAPSSTWKTL